MASQVSGARTQDVLYTVEVQNTTFTSGTGAAVLEMRAVAPFCAAWAALGEVDWAAQINILVSIRIRAFRSTSTTASLLRLLKHGRQA